MNLRERIAAALRDAEPEGDPTRCATLRLVMAAIRDRDLAARERGAAEATGDEELREMLARLAAQRRETARSYEEAGRLEQAAEKLAEAAVIEGLLPRRLGAADLDAAVDAAVSRLGAQSLRDLGRVMADLRPRLPGHIDPAELKALVRARLE